MVIVLRGRTIPLGKMPDEPFEKERAKHLLNSKPPPDPSPRAPDSCPHTKGVGAVKRPGLLSESVPKPKRTSSEALELL